MPEKRTCPECGTLLRADAPGGHCPRCLLQAGIGPTRTHVPSVSRVSAIGDSKPPSFSEFRALLLELGLAERADLDGLATGAEGDVLQLARVLVRAGKLTAYQAGALVQGKAKGLQIGRYLVLDKLGVGGMGLVFRARHRQTGQVVALKILPPSFAREKDAVRRFRREFQVAAHLNHPNIVAAIEADEDRGVHFLTMDYIQGRDLEILVHEDGPLAVKLALHCVIQIARGLEAAHAQGVIHRDVKPSNVMIDPAGTVRLCDLGLARIIEANSHLGKEAGGTLTQTGAYMGSVDFLAPEQADDAKKADHRADIYSLGCTLYFLLTGNPPFPGDTLLKRLIAHQDRPAPSLRATRPQVSESLEDVYLRMMAKRPADRPQSMTQVIAALEACRLSPREAGDASADLKTFATSFMKRAAPRKRRDASASVFAPSREGEGLFLDLDLDLEDVVAGFRPEVGRKPLKESDLPPVLPRLKPQRKRANPFTSTPLLATGLVCALLATGYFFRGQFLPAPHAPEPPPAPAAPARSVQLAVKPPAPLAPPQWTSLFNGRDLSGWAGEKDAYQIKDGLLSTKAGVKGIIYEPTQRSDFNARVEFRLSSGAEGGLLLRYPASGNSAYDSFCEIQILDDSHPSYANLDSRVYTGSAWGIAAATRGHLKPMGLWNVMEVAARGTTVKVILNGFITLDTDLARINRFHEDRSHPGKDRLSGYFGIQNGAGADGGRVEYRRIEIKDVVDVPEISALAAASGSASRATTSAANDAPPPAGNVIWEDTFDGPATGFPVGEVMIDNVGLFKRALSEGVYSLEAPKDWLAYEAWDCTAALDQPFEVVARGRVLGTWEAEGAWGICVPGPYGRGIQAGIDRGGGLVIYPAEWGRQAFPADPIYRPASPHRAITSAQDWNTLALRVSARQVEVLVNDQPAGDPITLPFRILPAKPEIGIWKWGASGTIRAEYDSVLVRTLDRGGAAPLDAEGRPLNLGFEEGTLTGWTAVGEAFSGQPVKGDTVFARRQETHSQHDRDFWVGTFEHLGDEAKGTLTSAPFRVTQPFGSFLISGGALPECRVEILKPDGHVLAHAFGMNSETLAPVAVDLTSLVGKEIQIRLVDDSADGWGHINFDDFRFHGARPEFTSQFALDPSLGPVIYADDFSDPASGWAVDNENSSVRSRYENGIYTYLAQPEWHGTSCSEWATAMLDSDFQVELTARVVGEAPNVAGGWGLIVGRQDGRGVHLYLDRNRMVNLCPSFWGVEKFPNDRTMPPVTDGVIRAADEFNTLTLQVHNRSVQILANGKPMGGPFDLGYDLLPATSMINLLKPDLGTRVRVEFDRIEVRSLMPQAQ